MRSSSASAAVVIDGAHGEGGGGVLRAALKMAALTQQNTRILNVRGRTRYPGLDCEDLTLLEALQKCCSAHVTGDQPGAHVLEFQPTRRPQALTLSLKDRRSESNRGANALVVLNALVPILARTGGYSSLYAFGETYGVGTLTYDYFENVTLGALKCFGLYAFPTLHQAGFGREAMGEVALEIEPSALSAVDWSERGSQMDCRAKVVWNGIQESVAQRGASHLMHLAKSSGLKMEIEVEHVAATGPGIFITTWARYERGWGGGTAMGAKNLRVEALAQTAFDQLFDFIQSPSCVDPYIAEHLLFPAVLAEDATTLRVSRLTSRLLSSISVIKQFTPIHITVRGSENGPGLLNIQR